MDEVPILVDRTRIPLALAPGIGQEDFSNVPVRGARGALRIRPARATFSVEAIAADERLATLLELEPGGPLLRCDQLTEDETGRPIEMCEMVYRGDRYRFHATLIRAGTATPPASEIAPERPPG